MNRSPQILGLDIGGANLKAAHTNCAARTVPFPLWKHPERLTAELVALCAAMPAHEKIAVTMTGELCDCFATKREGVRAILQSVAELARTTPARVWCARGCFLDIPSAMEDAHAVAAANWLALAHLVALRFPDERVLLIDTGSTTTDIVYLNRGVPEPRALDDASRLVTFELLYTGLRRTPVCTVLSAIHLGLAAEVFATMIDAYVLLGLLPENAADRDTADGRPLTRAAAWARLARMRCADTETCSEGEARTLADKAVREQQTALDFACGRVMTDRPDFERVIVAGSGEVAARSFADRTGKPVSSLAKLLGPALSEATCAYAVAVLAAQET